MNQKEEGTGIRQDENPPKRLTCKKRRKLWIKQKKDERQRQRDEKRRRKNLLAANKSDAAAVEDKENNGRNNAPSTRKVVVEDAPTKTVLGTLNIVDGSRLSQAIKAVNQSNVDICILSIEQGEFPEELFTYLGYRVKTTKAEDGDDGGVALVYRVDQKNWHMENGSTRNFGSHVISAVLVSGETKWHIVGVHMPSPMEDDSNKNIVAETCRFIRQAVDCQPKNLGPPILLGALNCNLNNPQCGRDKRVSTTIQNAGIHNVADYFPYYKNHWTHVNRKDANSGERRGSVRDYICAERSSSIRNNITNLVVARVSMLEANGGRKMVKAMLRTASIKAEKEQLKQESSSKQQAPSSSPPPPPSQPMQYVYEPQTLTRAEKLEAMVPCIMDEMYLL